MNHDVTEPENLKHIWWGIYFPLQGMMMGLGKRSADYLEDTGMLETSADSGSLIMGLISRSHVGFWKKKSK